MPVFHKDSKPEVFNQCSTCPNKVSVYFMRKHIAEQSRAISYADQEKLVQSQGFEVTPLIVRALFDAVGILKSRTCPDDRNPKTYARNSNTVRYGNNVHQSAIGGFAPHVGVCVSSNDYDIACIGVVPGVPEEVPQT